MAKNSFCIDAPLLQGQSLSTGREMSSIPQGQGRNHTPDIPPALLGTPMVCTWGWKAPDILIFRNTVSLNRMESVQNASKMHPTENLWLSNRHWPHGTRNIICATRHKIRCKMVKYPEKLQCPLLITSRCRHLALQASHNEKFYTYWNCPATTLMSWVMEHSEARDGELATTPPASSSTPWEFEWMLPTITPEWMFRTKSTTPTWLA